MNRCMYEWVKGSKWVLKEGKMECRHRVSRQTHSSDVHSYLGVRGLKILPSQRNCDQWWHSMPPQFSLWLDLGSWQGFTVIYVGMYTLRKRGYRVVLFFYLALCRCPHPQVQSTGVFDPASLCVRSPSFKLVEIEISLPIQSWLTLG